MADLIAWFGQRHPGEVIVCKAGGFVSAPYATEFVNAAERTGVGILSIEGFLVEAGGVAYPVEGRHRDLLDLDQLDCETFVGSSCGAARQILAGVWASDPTPDQTSSLHADVTYRHMIRFILDQ